MPFHFCSDELVALLAAIPFIGFIYRTLLLKFGKKQPEGCKHEHEHAESESHNG